MFGIVKPTGELMCHAVSDGDTIPSAFVAWRQISECVGGTTTGREYSPYLANHPVLAEVRMRKLNIIYNGSLRVRELTQDEIFDITIQKLKYVRNQTA